ncbi:MAG: PspC domain-containing protein [Anaerolineae bacterium]
MKRLYRSQHDRIIAGVCGGLGIYFGVNSLLFRILFVLLSAAGGLALPLYLLLWIAVPDAREVFSQEEQRLDREAQDHKSDTKRLAESGPWDAAGRSTKRASSDWLVLVGVAFVGVGLMILMRNLGLFSWLRVLTPLALVALGIALLIEVLNRQP